MKPLIIHPRAAKDAREIAAMYAEISDELRDKFWKEIDDAIDYIEKYPERHHYDPSGRRRSNLERFPYHILFEERLIHNRIMVIRIIIGILATGYEEDNPRSTTSRDTATPISRPVDMIFRNFNPNSVIDARPR